MKQKQLEKLFNARIKHCANLLLSKGKEYSDGSDRLRNFYDGSVLLGINPKQYALSLVTKHIVALKDHIMQNKEMSDEFIDEKISDIINYAVLIEALNKE
jgi:hypothetical protein